MTTVMPTMPAVRMLDPDAPMRTMAVNVPTVHTPAVPVPTVAAVTMDAAEALAVGFRGNGSFGDRFCGDPTGVTGRTGHGRLSRGLQADRCQNQHGQSGKGYYFDKGHCVFSLL